MWCGFVLFYFGLEILFEIICENKKKKREYLPGGPKDRRIGLFSRARAGPRQWAGAALSAWANRWAGPVPQQQRLLFFLSLTSGGHTSVASSPMRRVRAGDYTVPNRTESPILRFLTKYEYVKL
jgi:hypothetical protein